MRLWLGQKRLPNDAKGRSDNCIEQNSRPSELVRVFQDAARPATLRGCVPTATSATGFAADRYPHYGRAIRKKIVVRCSSIAGTLFGVLAAIIVSRLAK